MVDPLFRKPCRISITIPDQPYQLLVERSLREGRSLSNLAAFLLEQSVQQSQQAAHQQAADQQAADRQAAVSAGRRSRGA